MRRLCGGRWHVLMCLLQVDLSNVCLRVCLWVCLRLRGCLIRRACLRVWWLLRLGQRMCLLWVWVLGACLHVGLHVGLRVCLHAQVLWGRPASRLLHLLLRVCRRGPARVGGALRPRCGRAARCRRGLGGGVRRGVCLRIALWASLKVAWRVRLGTRGRVCLRRLRLRVRAGLRLWWDRLCLAGRGGRALRRQLRIRSGRIRLRVGRRRAPVRGCRVTRRKHARVRPLLLRVLRQMRL